MELVPSAVFSEAHGSARAPHARSANHALTTVRHRTNGQRSATRQAAVVAHAARRGAVTPRRGRGSPTG
jgi:hypothetical protein